MMNNSEAGSHLRLKDLCKVFKDGRTTVAALDDVNLNISPGRGSLSQYSGQADAERRSYSG